MTTRDYAEAYADDSENTRAWPAQDDREREFALEGDPIDLWNRLVDALAEIATQDAEIGRLLATIARMQVFLPPLNDEEIDL